MGLLDDAIREHLELKRRRGADPEEVAREQREALDAAAGRRTASTAVDDSAPAAGAPADIAIGSREVDGDGPSADQPEIDESLAHPARAAGADETAELDMSSVLGEGGDITHAGKLPGEADQPSNAGARPAPARPATEEDSLEWEVPGETVEDEAGEPAEDVLEETPDFLRDTPEQDRLWFEQQPPRDFDFDK